MGNERLGRNPLKKRPLSWIGVDGEVSGAPVELESPASPVEPVAQVAQESAATKVHKHFELSEELNERLRFLAYKTRQREVDIVRKALDEYLRSNLGD